MEFKGRNQRFPCRSCGNKCTTKFTKSCIKCSLCKQWYHTKCQNFTENEMDIWTDMTLPYVCVSCRTIGENEFDYVLGMHRLEKAASTKNIFNLREAVQRELLFRAEFRLPEEPIYQFPRVDPQAAHVLDNYVDDITGTPRKTSGDGDCLFNAMSVLLQGNETLSNKLRYHTCLSLVSNMDRYMRHPLRPRIQHLSCSYESACLASAKTGGYSSSWTILALSDVTSMSIRVIYPYANGTNDVAYQSLNAVFTHGEINQRCLYILWHKLDSVPNIGQWYQVNHFSAVTDTATREDEARQPAKTSTPLNNDQRKKTSVSWVAVVKKPLPLSLCAGYDLE